MKIHKMFPSTLLVALSLALLALSIAVIKGGKQWDDNLHGKNPLPPDTVVIMDEQDVSDTTLGSTKWFFAEGSTLESFDTWILIQNPNSTDAEVKIDYSGENGLIYSETPKIRAHSRFTRLVNSIETLENKAGVSTEITSTNGVGIVAERTMYTKSGDGHCSVGSTAPAKKLFFAEGSTKDFDTWILILNPNDFDARVKITCMDQDGMTYSETESIKAHSRFSRLLNNIKEMDDKTGVSTIVESLDTAGIVAERTMYWDKGSHCSIGYAEHYT